MTSKQIRHVGWFHSFRIFVHHFLHICFVFRGVLGALLLLVLSGGFVFSLFEKITVWKGIYFAIITSTTVGYGDITPATLVGQFVSIALALIGTIFFGLVVAAATRAVEVTVRDYQSGQNNTLESK